jgi:hypothetical protein
MTGTGVTLALKPLTRRFAAPALAAWLLYIGARLVLFAIERPVLALLTQTVGWVVDHFPVYLGSVEKDFASIQSSAQNMVEGAVLILVGLFVGLWIVRRKRQSLSRSD